MRAVQRREKEPGNSPSRATMRAVQRREKEPGNSPSANNPLGDLRRARTVIRVGSVTIRLGLQIPHFSYGTGVGQLFPTVVAQAREAESVGFDSVFVMDHFYQLSTLGSPDQPMLEAYTALGA
jgi:hypothetical protein